MNLKVDFRAPTRSYVYQCQRDHTSRQLHLELQNAVLEISIIVLRYVHITFLHNFLFIFCRDRPTFQFQEVESCMMNLQA